MKQVYTINLKLDVEIEVNNGDTECEIDYNLFSKALELINEKGAERFLNGMERNYVQEVANMFDGRIIEF